MRIKPEARANPRETASVSTTGEAVATVVASAQPEEPPGHGQEPSEPEGRGNPGEIVPAPATDGGRGRPHGRSERTKRRKNASRCNIYARSMRHRLRTALENGSLALVGSADALGRADWKVSAP
jgi:hypothetical protein